MSKISKILILVFVLSLLAIGLMIFRDRVEEKGISEEEKTKVEAWIIENDLNRYGDPKNIFYTGGTPLFDEKTGRSIDRYEYILKNHPDRPWLK